MRDILCRGKCNEIGKNNGKWLYGYLGVDSIDKPFIAPIQEDGSALTGYFCDPKSIGEYTGLKDKNDKRIFEGDIVKTHYANARKADFVEEIVFRNGRFCAKSGCSFNSLCDYTVHTINRENNIFMDSIEVIGNIHDNPELLEVRR